MDMGAVIDRSPKRLRPDSQVRREPVDSQRREFASPGDRPLLRLRAELRRRARAARDPRLAGHARAALGAAVLDAPPPPAGQAAAPPAPPGVLARKLAIRVPGLLRAPQAHARRGGRGRAVPSGADAVGRADRAPRARGLPPARRAAALAP